MDATLWTADWLLFWFIAGLRFLLPLVIPRYPLPGILVCLVLDAVDQSLFQQFTNLSLDGYQGYDKALDVYYLTIAYISTLRNWAHRSAFKASRLLFYWRLIGVAAFELTQARALLLVFANTFEYFFIFFEAYCLRWDPKRLRTRHLVGAAAAIWILIKLPQEYWIHIAQADATDWIKTGLLGLSPELAWTDILRSWPVLLFVPLLAVGALVLVIRWYLTRRAPRADRAPAFSALGRLPAFTWRRVVGARVSEASRIVDAALFEKLVLITLVSISFSQVLPGVEGRTFATALGVALVVVVNTALSHWLARHLADWAFTVRQLLVLLAANLALVLAYAWLGSLLGSAISPASVLFFAVLLALLVTLYDHHRQVYLMRRGV
jgi:hypothetical protein